MAFVAGFNNAAIQRLKFTRAELNNRSLKRLEALEALMSAESSYKNYRSVIHSCNPPLIPYMYDFSSYTLSSSSPFLSDKGTSLSLSSI